MYTELETERLRLRILTADDADKTLTFYQRNASIFEKYEPIVGENFYSLFHQQQLLALEYKEISQLHMLRFWIFEKRHPERVIGTVSFHNITPDIFSSAQVGYKMDADYWRRGYCYEALAASINMVAKDIGIRRFEALVLPDNIPSIGLLTKLGFHKEGLLREKIFLNNRWQDHYIYGLLVK